MTWRRILPMLLATLLMGVAYAVMFKTRVTHDAAWGRTTIVRQWGVEREVRMDRDLDGRTDARIRYPGSDRRISHHDRPSEIWIDSDLDGVVDLHWIDGDAPVLEQRLADGTMSVVRGDAAQIPNARLDLRTREELGLPSWRSRPNSSDGRPGLRSPHNRLPLSRDGKFVAPP